MIEPESCSMCCVSAMHDWVIVVILATLFSLGCLSSNLLLRSLSLTASASASVLEFLWAVLPIMVLVLIAIPRLRALYFIDTSEVVRNSLNVTGSQWFWSYETPMKGVDAFIEERIRRGPRNLSTDNVVFVDIRIGCRALVTARDVLHSWAVPSWGVKTDATPGRVCSRFVKPLRTGITYGQCSEICGANHRYIPITIMAA